jgi:cytochrome c-type biogenesis protein CcmH
VIPFIVMCAVMAVAAMVSVAWPLLRRSDDVTNKPARVSAVVAVVLIPLVAAGLYVTQSNWNWRQADALATQQRTAQEMMVQLEQRLQSSPTDVDGWLLLGRSYMALEQPQRSLSAFRNALEHSDRTNVEALLGVAESMMIIDERSITGEAGRLFEEALVQEPNNPKALWYSAIVSLAKQDLRQAHTRLQRLLMLNPPGEIGSIIERQLQDIEQQLDGTDSSIVRMGEVQVAPTMSQRAITVKVSIAPGLANNIDGRTPLFVVARDPAAPGPPLAAVRRAVGDLPFTVTITDSDAMMQGRGIDSAKDVQIVARISKSGAPQAQSGDLYGEANITFGADGKAEVQVTIDRSVAND